MSCSTAIGSEVVGLGDWDKDGTPDIAVLARGFDTVRCCAENQGFDGGMGTSLGLVHVFVKQGGAAPRPTRL